MDSKKAHWERAYQEKPPTKLGWYQKEPRLSLDLIHEAGIGKCDPLIDVGAGASTLIDRLCDEGFTALAALDISSPALAYAQTRLGGRATNVEWFESDVTEFVAPHPFRLWHDRATFHFLTDDHDRQKYISVLRRSLDPGGHLIIAAFALEGPNQCSGLDVVRYDSEKLLAELGHQFELVSEALEIHITPTGIEQKFGYFHFVLNTDS